MFGDFEVKQLHHVVLLTSPPALASELQWSAQTNLHTSATFFFVGLFEEENIYLKYKTNLGSRDKLQL